jgi:hypothetical protein
MFTITVDPPHMMMRPSDTTILAGDMLNVTCKVHSEVPLTKAQILFKGVHYMDQDGKNFQNKVRSTVRNAIHLQIDIGPNVLEIRAVQSPKCIV